MFLKHIKLQNFRNYSSIDFPFRQNVTVLIGENAQGKTNFLESIYLLATAKSAKADRDEELIKEGEEILRVEGEVSNEEIINLEIAMLLQNGKLTKKTKVNGIPRRTADYCLNLAVVFFTPENINMVTGSPSLRRYQLDQTLSQVDKSYKRTLTTYENIIVRKNRILKSIQEGLAKKDQLTYWLDQQIMLGSLLTQKRQEYFDFINTVEKKFGPFRYQYKPSEVTLERLREYEDREIASANSLIGPHRDDFQFFYEVRDLSKYGSRGEQRTAVLDLKFSEVEYVEHVLGQRPILLLDDIFSELDASHRQHVVDLAFQQQTIIASVDWDKSLEKALKEARVMTVTTGTINQSEQI
jgi:DNA replication and repair protein RecF